MTARVITGDVLHADQRGRLLGFPTANVRLGDDPVPRFGVYAGRLDGHPAAVGVGMRRTFGADPEPLLEAHLLEFSGDLYGRRVRVELLELVRGEVTADALAAEIAAAVPAVRARLDEHDRASAVRVERAVAALREGRVVVLDGSAVGHGASQLVVAGDHADATTINRLAAEARGLVALAMPASRCERLGLEPQRSGGHDGSGRPFTLSIEARRGVTTGISAQDRAVTVAAAIAPDATADDLVVPGHVFPVWTVAGGVLERPDAGEAAVDLLRLAGGTAAAVLCTMLDPRGEVAGPQELAAYARAHDAPRVSLGDVVAVRRAHARRCASIVDGDPAVPADGRRPVIR